MKTERRYDIDWLRVIAIALLLIYHVAIIFQPWGALIRFIQSDESWEGLWIPMSMLNVWRIPILFIVSGMGVGFALRKRSWKELLAERSRRILVPFVFGLLLIVPIHVLLWQEYYNQDIKYLLHPGHLWFLGNIFIYVLLIIPFLMLKERYIAKRFASVVRKLINTPIIFIIVPGVFAVEAFIVQPEIYTLYALTWHGFFLGLLAFLFGYYAIRYGINFWQVVVRWRWINLIVAGVFFIFRYRYFDLNAPNSLLALESNAWIFTVFGFAYKYLNHPGKALSYLSQGAYPIYIVHMIFLYLGAVIIIPLKLPVQLEFVLILIFTFAGCFFSYEFFIKRVKFLRPLFGLKTI